MPGLFPEIINIGGITITQTLFTSFLSLLAFIVFIFIFALIKSNNDESMLVLLIELLIEKMDTFFSSVSDKVPFLAKMYVLFLFFYILWNNLFGLLLDMFSLVNPYLHIYIRPVTTDIIFNMLLALVGVVGALIYGFSTNGLHFLEKYFPIVNGIGISGKRPKNGFGKTLLWLIVRIFDIFLGLFIGFLEIIGEFTKIASLSFRLFGNILAGIVLLTLVVTATIKVFNVPLLGPLVIVAMELFVGFLQAFVFSLLVMIYFKLAETTH